MITMFKERLKSYRKSLQITKREMSKRMDISETYYNMVENGSRQPSKNFLSKLVLISQKSEEYWVYGIQYNQGKNIMENFKHLSKAIEQMIDLDIVKDADILFQGTYKEGTIEELLIAALKTDINYILGKRRGGIK